MTEVEIRQFCESLCGKMLQNPNSVSVERFFTTFNGLTPSNLWHDVTGSKIASVKIVFDPPFAVEPVQPTVETRDWPALTPRQIDVLLQLLTGASEKQVAAR